MDRPLRGLAALPFFEQPRHVAGDGVKRRRPAQGARPRAADALIQREGVRIWAHLLPRLRERDVPDARLGVRMVPERGDDVVDRLVPFLVRMIDAGGGRGVYDARVELSQVPVVDERPVVFAAADDPDEAVGGVLQQVPDDAARAAIKDAWTTHAGAHARA